MVMATIPVLVAGLVCWRGWRRVDDGFLSKWQERFGVEVPVEEKPFLLDRLMRGRRLRSACVAVGVVVAGLPAYMNLIDPMRSATFANPLVGNAWLFGATLGALGAEVFVIQRPRVRRASLVVRRSRDYVDYRYVIAVYVIGASNLMLAVLATVLDWWRWQDAWIGVAAAIIAVAGVHLGIRAIIARPALAADGAMRDVDDALRSDGSFRVVGAALALATAGLTTVSIGDARGFLGAVSVLFGFVLYFCLGIWWTLARDVKWSVPLARSAS